MSSITWFLLALSLLSVNAASISGEKQIKHCKLDKWTQGEKFEYGRFKAKRTYSKAKEICNACDAHIVDYDTPVDDVYTVDELASNAPFWLATDFDTELQDGIDGSLCAIIRPNKEEKDPLKWVECSKSEEVICMRSKDFSKVSTPDNTTDASSNTTDFSEVSTPDNTTDASSNTTEHVGDFQHTSLLVHFETKVGENVFIRGGLDLKNCSNVAEDDNPCVIPMKTLRQSNMPANHTAAYDAWRKGDNFLDWYGSETGQGKFNGISAGGTPAIWTTNNTADESYNSLNTIGPHYWLLDVELDCSRTENGTFLFKAYYINLNNTLMEHWNSCEQKNIEAKCGAMNVIYKNGC